LENAKTMFAGLAVATSAPPENVDFVLDTLNLRQFFPIIVDETQVSKGKPDPEIYLKTANLLHANPKQCIVFEDSLSGIQAAKNAGMLVIGVTTTHSAQELANQVAGTIENFNDVLPELSKATQCLVKQ
jgi:beta-phosphoglucomutase-like phosphatase (HAD superfamily)